MIETQAVTTTAADNVTVKPGDVTVVLTKLQAIVHSQKEENKHLSDDHKKLQTKHDEVAAKLEISEKKVESMKAQLPTSDDLAAIEQAQKFLVQFAKGG